MPASTKGRRYPVPHRQLAVDVAQQKALAKNIPLFIQKIDETGANYHVGIATSDVGSDVAPGQLWGGNIGKCDTFEGDDGVRRRWPAYAPMSQATPRTPTTLP